MVAWLLFDSVMMWLHLFCTLVFGTSLCKPHIDGLLGAGCYGISYVCQFWPSEFRDQIYLHLSTLCGSGSKWVPLASVLNFPFGAHKIIIIWNEMTVAVQPCLPSKIHAAKSGIRATTTFVRFIRWSFRTHFKGDSWTSAIGCELLLRAGIAGLGCRIWTKTHFKGAACSTAICCKLPLCAGIAGSASGQ